MILTLTQNKANFSFSSSDEKEGFIGAVKTAFGLFKNISQKEIESISKDFFKENKNLYFKDINDIIEIQLLSCSADIDEILFLFGLAETYFKNSKGEGAKAYLYFKGISSAILSEKKKYQK